MIGLFEKLKKIDDQKAMKEFMAVFGEPVYPMNEETAAELQAMIDATIIPATVQLKDTEVSHMPINMLHKKHQAHLAFEKLADELIEKEIL